MAKVVWNAGKEPAAIQDTLLSNITGPIHWCTRWIPVWGFFPNRQGFPGQTRAACTEYIKLQSYAGYLRLFIVLFIVVFFSKKIKINIIMTDPWVRVWTWCLADNNSQWKSWPMTHCRIDIDWGRSLSDRLMAHCRGLHIQQVYHVTYIQFHALVTFLLWRGRASSLTILFDLTTHM